MNSLMAFMSSTMGGATSSDVTDDTEVYALLSTLDENKYYLSSLLLQNPQNPNIVLHTFTDGVNHLSSADKYIACRKSTDKAATFGTKFTLYDPVDSTFQIQDPGLGYDETGRLHIMADCHTDVGVPGETHELRYMYSDDDGTTVSSPVVITPPVTALLSFRMYGRIIDCGGGILLAPCYWVTEDGDDTESSRYCLRTTNGGTSWTWVLIDGPTTTYINETEFLHVGNGIVFAVSRYESLAQFWMYKSTDYGVTWTNLGPLGTGLVLTIAAPCRLHKFRLDDGTELCAMYFHDKGSTPKKVYAMYGRLNVGEVSGTGLFRTTTVTEIASDAAFFLNYGDICHYNNTLNARGVYSRELNFPTDNSLVYFECPATHYGSLFSILTPVTIYDALSSIMFIGSWRGLITNNSNDSGDVNVSSQVTSLKAILPGPVGTAKNFTATAGGITLGDGIVFDGTKAMTHGTLADWTPLQYSSVGYTDVNWTAHLCLKVGTGSDPNAVYGIFGNNAGSAANRGVYIGYDDRVSQPKNNAIILAITAGGGVFVINFSNDNIITPNTFIVLSIEVDLSQATQNNKVKVYINGTLQSTTVTTFNSGIQNTPAFAAQLGSLGNNVAIGVLTIKDVIFQNTVDIASVRDNIIDTLMDLEGL